MQTPPSVSLIIPTHQRSMMLIDTVRTLCSLDYPPTSLELIIVTDQLAASLEEAITAIELPFPFLLLEQAGQGAASHRNRGAALARGDLLIFLDDDMRAAPQLVAAHVNAHGQARNRVVIGYIPPEPTGRVGLLQLELRDWWETNFNQLRDPGHRFTYQDLFSGNFSLHRELFKKTGGFHTGYLCREDYEFGMRLLARKAQFVYCQSALSVHRDRTEIEHALRRKVEEGAAEVKLGREYPQLRSQLLMATLLADEHAAGNFLRHLAFHWAALGDRLTGLMRSWLSPLESLNLRHLWRRLQLGLSFYAYWRGVAARLPDVPAVRAFLSETFTDQPPETELVLDLAEGIEAAEQALDTVRPESARLMFGDLLIGVLPPMAGAERLRGPHLRPHLVQHLPLALARVKLQHQIAGLPAPVTPKPQPEPCPGEGIQVLELAGAPLSSHEVGLPADSPRTLLRLLGRPLKWVSPADQSASGHLPGRQDDLWYDLALPALLGIWKEPATPKPDPSVLFSIVICTRERPHLLADCLQALAGLDYPDFEILVVDNAPTTPDTERLCAQFPVRYVRENRPGLDIARNTGWQLAKGSLVAFTDDDARPDAGWLSGLAAAFTQPQVMAVTGPVLPCELSTPAQIAFEEGYGGMGHGFKLRHFQRSLLDGRQLLWASGFGVGANMAFRRAVLAELGGFDPALDVGTPAAGGGDVEFFHRLVARGHSLVYTPDALVWHLHRRTWAALQQQIYNNGRSFGVYLLTCWRNRTVNPSSIIWFMLFDWFAKWLLWRLIRPGRWPRRLVLAEILGALSAPAAYVQARQGISARESQPHAAPDRQGEP